MNILVACEESQVVCKTFRERGFNAFSCDILECSGGCPQWHFHKDVFEVIKNKGGHLESREDYFCFIDTRPSFVSMPIVYFGV